MKLFSARLTKLKIQRFSLISCCWLAAILILTPFGWGRLTVNEQGLAPALSGLNKAKYLNWFEVASLTDLPLQSQSAVIVDVLSGRIVGAKDPRRVLPLASLTKLMTIKLVAEQGFIPEQIISVESMLTTNRATPYVAEDNAVSQLGLRRVESFKAKDLLLATLVASANDAALALANGVKLNGDNFIKAVGKEITRLNLSDTRVLEPTGLNPANVSTAIGVAQLAGVVWQDNLYRQSSGLKVATIKSQQGTVYNLTNTNDLFKQATGFKILASKTGHLNEVGYNLAQIIQTRQGEHYLMVLLGAASKTDRDHDAKILADWLSL